MSLHTTSRKNDSTGTTTCPRLKPLRLTKKDDKDVVRSSSLWSSLNSCKMHWVYVVTSLALKWCFTICRALLLAMVTTFFQNFRNFDLFFIFFFIGSAVSKLDLNFAWIPKQIVSSSANLCSKAATSCCVTGTGSELKSLSFSARRRNTRNLNLNAVNFAPSCTHTTRGKNIPSPRKPSLRQRLSLDTITKSGNEAAFAENRCGALWRNRSSSNGISANDCPACQIHGMSIDEIRCITHQCIGNQQCRNHNPQSYNNVDIKRQSRTRAYTTPRFIFAGI